MIVLYVYLYGFSLELNIASLKSTYLKRLPYFKTFKVLQAVLKYESFKIFKADTKHYTPKNNLMISQIVQLEILNDHEKKKQ